MRFDDVGPIRSGDIRVTTDPRTRYYTEALALAKTIIANTARDLNSGGVHAWAFLIRTPDAVELGVRRLLELGLRDEYRVTKQGRRLPDSDKTLNPDLVFDDGEAIADVKYKLQGAEWHNDDLYQVVTFATGYRTPDAALISFTAGHPPRPPLRVGDVTVTNICWSADGNHEPVVTAAAFVSDVRAWLQSAQQRRDHALRGAAPGVS